MRIIEYGLGSLITNSNYKKEFILNVNIDNELLIKGGIKNYDDYIEHVFGNGDKRGKMFLYKKINELKDKLKIIYGKDIDPIHYLIQLYYGDGLSIKDISIRLENLGWQNKNINSLEKTFKLTFLWELRNTSGSEVATKKRKNNGQIDSARAIYKSDINKRYKQLNDFISEKINGILNIKNFDFEGFDNLKKSGKILYILYFLYGISKCNLKELQKKGIGAKVITNYLNENLKGFFNELGINFIIYPKDIQEIFNEN